MDPLATPSVASRQSRLWDLVTSRSFSNFVAGYVLISRIVTVVVAAFLHDVARREHSDDDEYLHQCRVRLGISAASAAVYLAYVVVFKVSVTLSTSKRTPLQRSLSDASRIVAGLVGVAAAVYSVYVSTRELDRGGSEWNVAYRVLSVMALLVGMAIDLFLIAHQRRHRHRARRRVEAW